MSDLPDSAWLLDRIDDYDASVAARDDERARQVFLEVVNRCALNSKRVLQVLEGQQP